MRLPVMRPRRPTKENRDRYPLPLLYRLTHSSIPNMATDNW